MDLLDEIRRTQEWVIAGLFNNFPAQNHPELPLGEVATTTREAETDSPNPQLVSHHKRVWKALSPNAKVLWSETRLPRTDLSLHILEIRRLIMESGKGYLIFQPPSPTAEERAAYLKAVSASKWEYDVKHQPGPDRRAAEFNDSLELPLPSGEAKRKEKFLRWPQKYTRSIPRFK